MTAPLPQEGELLPLSALQHLQFCPRQCALIHLEGIWAENRLTAEGRVRHERVDAGESEQRGDLRIARAVPLCSSRLGLIGKSDVVEYHRLPDEPPGSATAMPAGVILPGLTGRWRVYPVEYKRGKPKADPCDEIQLCAQAMCLEDMLGVAIPAGALFYFAVRQRLEIVLTDDLRQRTLTLCQQLQALVAAGRTPAAVLTPKCRQCSLQPHCLPGTTDGHHSAAAYLQRALAEHLPPAAPTP